MRSAASNDRPPAGGRRACDQAGFTLVELVIVMLLVGILATVGAARFADRDLFAVKGAADRLASALRLAQVTAIAQRADIHVRLTASPAAMAVCADPACAAPIPAPGGEAWLPDAQGLVLSADAAFQFTPGGGASLSSPLALTVANAAGTAISAPVRIEPGSGHVHSP